jgi:hypothetical protein
MLLNMNQEYIRGGTRRNKSQILGDLAPVKSRFVDRNTVEWIGSDGVESVRLHDTDIIVRARGRIVFDTGGWKTVTTKDRLNKFAPPGWQFWSERGVWQVSTPAGVFPFVDGAAFWIKSGKPCKPTLHRDESAKLKAEKKLISAYVAEVRKGFSLESGGDPFIPPDPATGLYERDMVLSWLRDKYVFPTLIYHALRSAGMAREGAAWWMQQDAGGSSGHSITAGRVRRYLARCLGHAV